MNPAKLRHRVQLLIPGDQTDTLGDSNTQYTPGPVVYAAIESTSAPSEIWLAQQAQGKAVYSITIRYRPDVTAKWRIAYPPMTEGQVSRIFECGPPVNTDFRNVELVIPCVEHAK